MAEGEYIKVKDHIRFGIFHLLVVMCFGSELNESQVQEMEVVQRQIFNSSYRFRLLDAWPWLSRTILRHFCKELFDLRKKREEWLIPLIRTYGSRKNHDSMTSYLGKLVTLELKDESNRKLNESELVSFCSEFLNAGTDTTVTLLEWIMANLVKYPDIQHKLFNEIKQVIGEKAMEVDEEALSKIDYLKAVVLEGLRRHPPAHFTLPHSVTKQVQLGGFTIPKNSIINFSIAEMGLDRKVWEDPLKFWPERFLSSNGEFDVACKREIKMMPFGAGRRICPANGLAILHLQYFVANLVWNFEWSAIDGDEIDFSEKKEITVAIKYPLHAQVTPRNFF